MNVGDALRELDRRNIVTGDFILLNADVVSNVNLGPILAEHKYGRGPPARNAAELSRPYRWLA